MTKLLITGAAGRLGANIVRQVLDKGYDVRGLVLPDDPKKTKLDGLDLRVYASTSDGENQEGQPWEMATSAVHYGLDNLCLMLDWNGIQIDGNTSDVMDTGNLRAKWESFGWHALEVDGHSVDALFGAFEEAKAENGRPSILCCRTSIGKGVSFMEDTSAFHGCAPDDEQYETALAELTAAAP